MSGRPNPEGVRKYVDAVKEMEQLALEIETSSKEVQRLEKKLEVDKGKYSLAKANMLKLMAEMDVYSSGNAGYEGRIGEFVKMVYQQTRDQAMKEARE
jgi:hypothetical protein